MLDCHLVGDAKRFITAGAENRRMLDSRLAGGARRFIIAGGDLVGGARQLGIVISVNFNSFGQIWPKSC